MSLLRKLWDLWKAFGHVLGQIQSTILLAIIYHVAVGPLAVIGKLMRNDILHLKANPGDTYAEALAPITTTIEKAEKQF